MQQSRPIPFAVFTSKMAAACDAADCVNVVWGTAQASDSIVWGTAGEGEDDNIVWGTNALDESDNIVWGASAIRRQSRLLVTDPPLR